MHGRTQGDTYPTITSEVFRRCSGKDGNVKTKKIMLLIIIMVKTKKKDNNKDDKILEKEESKMGTEMESNIQKKKNIT